MSRSPTSTLAEPLATTNIVEYTPSAAPPVHWLSLWKCIHLIFNIQELVLESISYHALCSPTSTLAEPLEAHEFYPVSSRT